MLKTRFIAAALAVLASLSCATLSADESDVTTVSAPNVQSPVTVDSLAALAAKRYEKLDACRVTFDSERYDASSKADAPYWKNAYWETQGKRCRVGRVEYVQRTQYDVHTDEYFDGVDRYELTALNATETPQTSDPDAVGGRHDKFASHPSGRELCPLCEFFELTQKKEYPFTLGELLTSYPPKSLTTTQDDSGDTLVLVETEIDDTTSSEKIAAKLTLNLNKGAVVRDAEFVKPDGTVVSFQCSLFQEFASGIWFPQTIVKTVQQDGQDVEPKTTTHIRDVELANVQLTPFQIPKGTPIYEYNCQTKKERVVISGGLFAKSFNNVNNYLDYAQGGSSKKASMRSDVYVRTVVVLAGVLFLALVLYRRTRRVKSLNDAVAGAN